MDHLDRAPTQRFSDRVRDYARHRPGYPGEILPLLRSRTGLSPSSVVADVGSGTGILSRLLLEHGNTVFGVEPNDEMRRAAEESLSGFSSFRSVAGAAEDTTLAGSSVDFVFAAQSFHWFDFDAAKVEFRRVLAPNGWVVLLWNTRRREGSAFLRAYEDLLLRHGTDYRQIDHRRVSSTGRLSRFFGAAGVDGASFPNSQLLDWDGLKGRLLSSSYTPAEGHPGHRPMLDRLRLLFDEHETDGRVNLEYDTEVFFGRID